MAYIHCNVILKKHISNSRETPLNTWRYLTRRRCIRSTLFELISACRWTAAAHAQDEIPQAAARTICNLMLASSGQSTGRVVANTAIARTLDQLDELLGQPTTPWQYYIANRRILRLTHSLIQRGLVVVSPAIGELEPRYGRTMLQFYVRPKS